MKRLDRADLMDRLVEKGGLTAHRALRRVQRLPDDAVRALLADLDRVRIVDLWVSADAEPPAEALHRAWALEDDAVADVLAHLDRPGPEELA